MDIDRACGRRPSTSFPLLSLCNVCIGKHTLNVFRTACERAPRESLPLRRALRLARRAVVLRLGR
eukprot:4569813-Prymnesium_polylepis.1